MMLYLLSWCYKTTVSFSFLSVFFLFLEGNLVLKMFFLTWVVVLGNTVA